MSDEKEMMRLLSNGKTVRQGFEMLVNLYSEKLYWQIRRIVVSHDDADDVLQNTLIKAWLNLNSFQKKSKISTWLSRIAINEAIDFIRKKQRTDNISADDNPTVSNQLMADEYFDGDETQAQLQEAIALLPPVQRAVFNMRYFEEMKYSQISEILETSEGALKSSYHIAVKKIEAFFKELD
jgi:RNA polymerase sigma factor (sigma-70 family)